MVVIFPSDDLIYNRFDLIYDEVRTFRYVTEYGNYEIDIHCTKEGVVLISTWGKTFPQEVFEECIKYVFRFYPNIRYIKVTRTGNNYKGILYKSTDIYILLPKTSDSLFNRLNGKHRYTLRKKKRLLQEKIGSIRIKNINLSDITSEMVEEYFRWKRQTHGVEYKLTPKEYLVKYHVTNSMLVFDGNQSLVGIVFYCKVNNTVYLENFSYNYSLRKYSIGAVLYWLFLESLISLKCKYCFLGGGRYEYKKHFGAIECVTYSGKIYSSRYIDRINIWLKSKGIYKVAIYGIGAVGEAFLIFAKKLDICVCYGIDKNSKKFKELSVYAPSDDIPCVDAVFITINSSYNEEIEIFMKKKKLTYYYWNDIDKYVP